MVTPEAYTTWHDGKIVPGRIALARTRASLDQQELADAAGTDIITVDLWEQGVEYPSWRELVAVCTATGVDASYLSRPVTGPGALYAVPDSWDESGDSPEGESGDPSEVLVPGYCREAVVQQTSQMPAVWPARVPGIQRAL